MGGPRRSRTAVGRLVVNSKMALAHPYYRGPTLQGTPQGHRSFLLSIALVLPVSWATAGDAKICDFLASRRGAQARGK